METRSRPPRKISRRTLLRTAIGGAGVLAAAALFGDLPATPSIVAKVETPPPAARKDSDPNLLEGKEREFKLKQLRNFLGEFVTPKSLDMFEKNGFLPVDRIKVSQRTIPNMGTATNFYVDAQQGRVTLGVLVNREDGILKEATIFADRGQLNMDQFAEGVRGWLKDKDVKFRNVLYDDTEPETETRVEGMVLKLSHIPDQSPVPGERPVDPANQKILVADVTSRPVLYKHPERNIYYAVSQNSVAVFPDGQVVFHQEMAGVSLSSDRQTI